MTDYHDQFKIIKDNFIMGNYALVIKEAGAVVEKLFKELYQHVLFNSDYTQRDYLMKLEGEIGKGKTINNFGLGEIVGLFRKGDLMTKYEKLVHSNLTLAKDYKLDALVSLRNSCTHNNYTPSKIEAYYIFQCIMIYLTSLSKLKIDEVDYLDNIYEARKSVDKIEDQLHSLLNQEHSTVINMFPLDVNMNVWEGFVGTYYAWNPSWQTEAILDEDEWYNIHKRRYENQEIKSVEYIISRSSDCGHRFEDQSQYFGYDPFINYMKLLSSKLPDVSKKLKIYIVDDLNSRLTFFFGKTPNGRRSLIMLNDYPFLEGESPNYLFVSEDESLFNLLKKHFDRYRTLSKRYNLGELLNS